MTNTEFRNLLRSVDPPIRQRELASFMGYSYRQVNRWATGESVISRPIEQVVRQFVQSRVFNQRRV